MACSGGSWKCVIVHGSVLWFVAAFCGSWQRFVVHGSVLWFMAVCCGLRQCVVAVCCGSVVRGGVWCVGCVGCMVVCLSQSETHHNYDCVIVGSRQHVPEVAKMCLGQS